MVISYEWIEYVCFPQENDGGNKRRRSARVFFITYDLVKRTRSYLGKEGEEEKGKELFQEGNDVWVLNF